MLDFPPVFFFGWWGGVGGVGGCVGHEPPAERPESIAYPAAQHLYRGHPPALRPSHGWVFTGKRLPVGCHPAGASPAAVGGDRRSPGSRTSPTNALGRVMCPRGGASRSTKRSTHARPGMHMQQCSAVPLIRWFHKHLSVCTGCTDVCHVTLLSGRVFFFWLTPEVQRVLKTWQSGRLQHMIQWIPATRGTWQRPRVHMRILEGSLMR